MTAQESKPAIQVIARMMTLLDALAEHTGPVNLKRLAAQTRLHPSTAHRILSVMVRSRFVDRVEPGVYRLGMRLLELGTLVRSRLNVRQEALPYMRALHQQLGACVDLSVRHDDAVIYLERMSARSQLTRAARSIGAPTPLHVTAVGKVFLAADGPDECMDYAKRTGLPKFTANTLTDHANLLKQIQDARRQGYAFDDEEAQAGISCVGAGIYDESGNLVAGLSVSAPSERFDKAWAIEVKQMTERISRALGNYSAPSAVGGR
jgi:DNA-binding IclR family transcriptional regulator